MNTQYHSKLFANQILLRSGEDSPERISRALNDACVDLNPHQVKAALFALKNPLSNGCILADEVGLGKTIEAGLVISQSWAEGKRSILIIAPKSLRHQWQDELSRLFGLSSIVLSGADYRKMRKSGKDLLQERSKIIISNEHFVDSFGQDVRKAHWDLIVIDEAHKLRNVWRKAKSEAKRAKVVRDVLAGRQKLLLTATPMQNNLMELYGLTTFIDDHILGTPDSFQTTFCNVPEELRVERYQELKNRMSRFFNRELRKNVREYIQYTNRNSITFTYSPTDEEEELRIGFEEFLRRDRIIAIPSSGMPLLKLVYLKLLASSTFAIKNSLLNLYKRLTMASVAINDKALFKELVAKIEITLTLPDGRKADEWERFNQRLYHGLIEKTYEALRTQFLEDSTPDLNMDDEPEINEAYAEADTLQEEVAGQSEGAAIPPLYTKEEIEEEGDTLLGFISLSLQINDNKKAEALKEALTKQFQKAKEEGWPEKAVIFTEFRYTQNYILRALKEFGLDLDKDVVVFNGDSGDVEERKKLIEDFKASKKIFLTTEAGSEGLNLQFCNLLLNYDLPWNPQRIEQRIGRCHRYGQKLDVIVVNFINTKNSSDVRVFELLRDKFKLFQGAFGASDEVLGAIESGHDFEQEILKIYLSCRTEDEIQSAFAELKQKLSPEIDRRMAEVRATVLEEFDEDVQSKLKLTDQQTKTALNEFGQKLKAVISAELGSETKWQDDHRFTLEKSVNGFPAGRYSLDMKDSDYTPVRTGSGIGEAILTNSASRGLGSAQVHFSLASRKTPVAQVQQLDGQSGILTAGKLKSQSFGFEERIVLAGMTDSGELLDAEVIEKMFRFSADVQNVDLPKEKIAALEPLVQGNIKTTVTSIKDRNQTIFESEIDRLDKWADDIKLSLELEIKAIDREIRQAKADAKKKQLLDEKVEAQKQVKALEAKRNDKRRQLFEAQDQIETEKDQLLEKIESNLEPKVEFEPLFTIQWKVS
jgi:adenine-specific DNA-methyltransferase